jgi:hypothetical protein
MRILLAIAMGWLGVQFVAQQVQDIKQLRDEQEDSEDLG